TSQWRLWRNCPPQPVCSLIKRLLKLYLDSILSMSVLFMAFLHFLNHFQLCRYLGQYGDHFTAFPSGHLALLQLVFCKFCLECELSSGQVVNCIVCLVMYAFTVTVFLQLNQQKQLLSRGTIT